MPLFRFHHILLALAIFTSACAPVEAPKNIAEPATDPAPYQSRLNEPQSNAYFEYMKARMLLADGDHEGAVAAYDGVTQRARAAGVRQTLRPG